MKIVFIGCRDITLIGGIESYMYNLTSQLTKMGYSCVVYCESDSKGHSFLDGVEIYQWKSYSSNFLTKPILSIKSTIHALIHHKDAMVYHYNTFAAAFFCWIPRLFRKRVILQGHGFEWKRTKYSPVEQAIIHVMEFLTAKMAQNLIMVSEEQTVYYQRHYHLSPVTIPCAVTPAAKIEKETASNFLNKYDLEKNKYFFFLGRLVEEKNPLVLIEAFKKYCTDYSYKLCLSGDLISHSKYASQIKAAISDNKNIILTGPVYQQEKNALLQNCGCFCLPSSMEGLSISLLEAMDAEVPIICSEIPACIEAVKNNGLFVKPGDIDSLGKTMVFHLNNRYRPSSIQKNKERIRLFFIWESVSKQYSGFVQKICCNH